LNSIPAMPTLSSKDIDDERRAVALDDADYEWVSDAGIAFCHAQARAHYDGKRRRVFKHEGVWHIEVAS
jgi:hypothetical protein